MKTDVLIIGAGPAGIFTALELVRSNYKGTITLVEKGVAIEKRVCPKHKLDYCTNCKNCAITTGFSGAGAFSDGKLSLSPDVGGELPDLIGNAKAQELIKYADEIYLEFGADPKIEGIDNLKGIADVRRRAIAANLKLVDCPIRHLGTEKAQEVYKKIQDFLLSKGVTILFNTDCLELIINDNKCRGAIVFHEGAQKEISATKTVVATGRRGADWLEKQCRKNNVKHKPGQVDIGVRVEVRNEIMNEVNELLYESKLIGYPAPFGNKVRTFCQNPGGFVSQENYDNNLALVNGHSYKDLKSENTNLAILCSFEFTTPFKEPIEYGKKVAELSNMLGGGNILVQRFGDILAGKRTWEEDLAKSNINHTLKGAVAGDITAAIPYRAMISIINYIHQLDKVVPGFASDETLLYSPEIKFYSNKIHLETNLDTSVENLHALGDSTGWTRGLMMASAMGVLMARQIGGK